MKRGLYGFVGLLAGTACGLLLASEQARNRFTFRGRCVVITGGSCGLGLVMARQLAHEGAKLALLARDADELKRAEAELRRLGAEVLSLPCETYRGFDSGSVAAPSWLTKLTEEAATQNNELPRPLTSSC